jgi:TetR/AcrR family transcriptional regulator, cholesterol catabolism regulator
MPTRPDRPALRARYDRRQAEVVEDAARVFAQRGYDQTSVPQLAEEVGLAAGSLYHYFGGKEQLLIAICDQLMDPLLGEARALLADVDGDPGDQLRALVRLWVGHVIAHRDHMLVFLQERHVIDHGDQWAEVRRSRKAFEQLVEALLARLEADGRARLGDARLTLSALLGMVNHTAQWYRPRGRLDATAVADGYVDLVLA